LTLDARSSRVSILAVARVIACDPIDLDPTREWDTANRSGSGSTPVGLTRISVFELKTLDPQKFSPGIQFIRAHRKKASYDSACQVQGVEYDCQPGIKLKRKSSPPDQSNPVRIYQPIAATARVRPNSGISARQGSIFGPLGGIRSTDP